MSEDWTLYARGVKRVQKKDRGSRVGGRSKISIDPRPSRPDPASSTLDLHGLTEAAAHAALLDFIPAQHILGTRKILVITGKGKGGDGVLRRNFPLWCEAPALARYISSVFQAPLQQGGAGAWVVALRK